MNPWVRYPRPQPGAGIRLFCLPGAGAGIAPYRPWVALGRSDVELGLITLPGRERRAREPLVPDLQALGGMLADGLLSELTGRYAIFGYSVGALIAFEFTRRLEVRGERAPDALFLAAQPAPHLPKREPVGRLTDDEFKAFLGRLGGTPHTLLADDRTIGMFLAPIRADFILEETYVLPSRTRLRCPIHALIGSDDRIVSRQSMEAWGHVTAGPFDLHVLPGDHFFALRRGDDILEMVARLGR